MSHSGQGSKKEEQSAGDTRVERGVTLCHNSNVERWVSRGTTPGNQDRHSGNEEGKRYP